MRFTHKAPVFAAASLTLALLAVMHADVTADDVTTTAGKKIPGKLVGVDAQGITFTTNEAKVPISARDIVVVDLGNPVAEPPKGQSYSEIELTDGSTFRVAKFALKGKKFETSPLPGKATPDYNLPMNCVFSAMKRADEPVQRANWKKMLATRGKRDLYVIQQETGLTFVQGTIQEGGSDGKNINFVKEAGGKADELLQSRSAGLVFYQPQPASVPATLCHVLDVCGNSLNAAAITIAPEGIVVTTVAGASVRYSSMASLSKLNYALGNIAYLSDLNPQIETPELPAEEKKLNPTAAVLKDRSLSNDSIKLDNVIYSKGLCVAPDSVVTYAARWRLRAVQSDGWYRRERRQRHKRREDYYRSRRTGVVHRRTAPQGQGEGRCTDREGCEIASRDRGSRHTTQRELCHARRRPRAEVVVRSLRERLANEVSNGFSKGC